MPPVAKLDRVRDISVEENDGTVLRLTRSATVLDLTDNTYAAVFSALDALGLEYGATVPEAPNLILRRRSAAINDDKGSAECELVYEHFSAAGVGQSFESPVFGLLVPRISSSLTQTRSNKDENGDTITLQHTYPADDPNHPLEIIIQGGEIEYEEPTTVLAFEGIVSNAFVNLVTNFAIGAINAGPWWGRPEGEWRCNSVDVELFDGANDRWRISITFQSKAGGWQPQIWFIDDHTGAPPRNLIQGVGIKTILKLPYVDFSNVLGIGTIGG